jgi:glycine C-acetyltransferase
VKRKKKERKKERKKGNFPFFLFSQRKNMQRWWQQQRWASGLSVLKPHVQQLLADIRKAGTYKQERIIVSSQSSNIKVQLELEKSAASQEVLNFCANNYLGLADHPEIREASEQAIKTHGAGLSSVRFICGTQDIHKHLEQKVALFHRKEAAILYPSCFDANGGLFEALLTEQDAIISDALNHESIFAGIRLSKAKRLRYRNCDMSDLETRLKEADAMGARIKLIATDGVFSMDGRIAPLDKICDLADIYRAVVFVDECHATGFFGNTGRGTPEYFNVEERVDIINSTFGKALGGASGGYTTAPKEIIELLRQKSRPYLFSNTLAPAVVGAATKAIDIVLASNTLRQRLVDNTHRFRKRMKEAGFTIRGDDHPICPVMLGDARLATVFADDMLQRGIYVIGFSYPVVPEGEARIRVQLSAAHTLEQVDRAIDAFIEVGRMHHVIP